MIFSESDRLLLKSLKMWTDQFHDWVPMVSAQMKGISEGQDRLLQSHAALEEFSKSMIASLENRIMELQSQVGTMNIKLALQHKPKKILICTGKRKK